ncbi:unnamed protein product [Urochloa humidicola]
MNKKFSFRCRSSLPAIYALVLAIIVAITIVPCSEVQAAHDATVAHPDGSRRGRWPPAPFGNPARGYDVPPPPQQRRRLACMAPEDRPELVATSKIVIR